MRMYSRTLHACTHASPAAALLPGEACAKHALCPQITLPRARCLKHAQCRCLVLQQPCTQSDPALALSLPRTLVKTCEVVQQVHAAVFWKHTAAKSCTRGWDAHRLALMHARMHANADQTHHACGAVTPAHQQKTLNQPDGQARCTHATCKPPACISDLHTQAVCMRSSGHTSSQSCTRTHTSQQQVCACAQTPQLLCTSARSTWTTRECAHTVHTHTAALTTHKGTCLPFHTMATPFPPLGAVSLCFCACFLLQSSTLKGTTRPFAALNNCAPKNTSSITTRSASAQPTCTDS